MRPTTPGTCRNWWDLSEEERGKFRQYVVKNNVQGWDELKDACIANRFEPDENMPTIDELKEDAGITKAKTYVIRLDVEVFAIDEDDAGEMLNKLTEFAVEVIGPEHYRWQIAQLDDGLEDADLEKTMAKVASC